MRIEVMLGTKNVLRFPSERRARPMLELLREIAPDVREVLNIAEAFGMAPPAHGLREQVDAATAEHIAYQVPTGGSGRAAMLAELLDPVVAAVVATCRASHNCWLPPLWHWLYFLPLHRQSEIGPDGHAKRGGFLPRCRFANARANDMHEVWNHPQLRARDRWRSVATPAGDVPALLPPGSWDEGDPRMDPIPTLGAHTNTILAELGIGAKQIVALCSAGAI